eukprot:4184216-Alexandrium_andersonii.AAC.1
MGFVRRAFALAKVRQKLTGISSSLRVTSFVGRGARRHYQRGGTETQARPAVREPELQRLHTAQQVSRGRGRHEAA